MEEKHTNLPKRLEGGGKGRKIPGEKDFLEKVKRKGRRLLKDARTSPTIIRHQGEGKRNDSHSDL